MASTDDMFNAAKNSVTATNGIATTISFLYGNSSALNLSATAVVKGSSGWVSRVSVNTAGSSAGMLYDTNVAANAGTSNLLAAVPNAAAIIDIKLPFATGLVFVPGTGMAATVSYS